MGIACPAGTPAGMYPSTNIFGPANAERVTDRWLYGTWASWTVAATRLLSQEPGDELKPVPFEQRMHLYRLTTKSVGCRLGLYFDAHANLPASLPDTPLVLATAIRGYREDWIGCTECMDMTHNHGGRLSKVAHPCVRS